MKKNLSLRAAESGARIAGEELTMRLFGQTRSCKAGETVTVVEEFPTENLPINKYKI